MKRINKIAVLLVSFMVFESILWARQRMGAEVVVNLKSGAQIKGELVAVKKDFIVLSSWGPALEGDQSIRVADVREIRIVRRSKTALGGRQGLLVGGLAGAVIGYAAGDDEKEDPIFGTVRHGLTRSQKAYIGAAALGVLGLAAGALIGGWAGLDSSISLENPEGSLERTLAKLSGYARIPGIQ